MVVSSDEFSSSVSGRPCHCHCWTSSLNHIEKDHPLELVLHMNRRSESVKALYMPYLLFIFFRISFSSYVVWFDLEKIYTRPSTRTKWSVFRVLSFSNPCKSSPTSDTFFPMNSCRFLVISVSPKSLIIEWYNAWLVFNIIRQKAKRTLKSKHLLVIMLS